METSKRTTVYLDAEVHRALRLKAAVGERTVSDLVNEAVRLTLAEDADDAAALHARASERSVSFESVVQRMRRSGRI